MKQRAVIYTRVSTAEQVENYSLDEQERACRAEAQRLEREVVEVFREEGESAKSADRTELIRMLNYLTREAKRLGIDTVIIYRVDRFARKAEDHFVIKAQLKRLKVKLHFVEGKFDDSPGGELMETVSAAFAQYDNSLRAQRTREGMKSALRAGRWPFRPPVGYRKPNGVTSPSLELDPATAPLVLRAFEITATSTRSQRDILEEVTALGLRTANGSRVSLQAFGAMLKNRIYVGRACSPGLGVDVKGDFTPIVPEELFSRAQGDTDPCPLDGRRRDHPDFPLRRIVRCPKCDAPITASWSKGRSRRYAYYRCPKRGCGGVNVAKPIIESQLLEMLAARSVRPEVLALFRTIVEDAYTKREAGSRDARKLVQKKLDDLSERKARLVEAFVQDKAIDKATYDESVRRLEREIVCLERELERQQARDVNLPILLDFAQALLSDLQDCWNRLDWQQRPGFLAALFPHGLTYVNGRIGTGENPWLFGGYEGQGSSLATLAPPTGFEPVPPP
jgi:site-specific DNA recombinase